MKKTVAIILLICMSLTCAACGQKAETESAPTWQEQYDLGVRYLSEGNYEEAIIAFTAAIEIDPKRPEAYLDMAYAYIGQSDFDAAREILEKGYVLTQDDALKAKLDELDSGTVKDYTGNILRRSFYDGTGALVGYQAYAYDEKNRVSSATSFDAAGNQTGHVDKAYDTEGRELTGYSYSGNDGTIRSKIVYEYDGSGNRIKEEFYDLDIGKLDRYTLLQHDSQGRLIREDNYNADGEFLSYYLYTYGENSERRDFYNADGSLLGYQVWNYREDGQLVDYCDYDADGSLSWRKVYRYDDNGKQIGTDSYDGEGNLTGSIDYE